MCNEKGFVIIPTLLILCLLTIIGIASTNISNTELKISTNNLIHHMEFYGADSAFAYGSVWAEENISPGNVGPGFGPDPYTLGNGVTFTTEIECLDEPNVEPISGMPDIIITGTGTHPRGGKEVLAQTWRYIPAFQDPGAPIRSTSELLTIQGSPNIDTNGEDVPEVLYDMEAPDSIDPPGVTEVEFAKESICADGECSSEQADPENYLDWDAMRENAWSLANSKLVPDGSGQVSMGDMGSDNYPVVIFITVGEDPVKITGNGTGYGVLFIDGDVDTISGTLEWYGPVIINGEIHNKVNGNITIYGSLFLNNKIESEVLEDDEDDLYGNMSVIYDVDALNNIHDKRTGYKPTPSWHYVN